MRSDLLQLYKYIGYCLHLHQSKNLRKAKIFKDMQHDIFLYLVDVRGVNKFNAGSKRYAYILSQYYPSYLQQYKYSRKAEEVLIDENGNHIEPGISNFVNADIQYDLDLIEKKKKESFKPKLSLNGKPILVQYITGEEEIFESIREFCRFIGCHESTVNIWIRKGLPTKTMANEGYRHLKKIEYINMSNPFAGSRLVVKKSITESQWNKRMDKEDYELDDYNEYYILYQHKESKEGLLVKLPAQKTNPYIK